MAHVTFPASADDFLISVESAEKVVVVAPAAALKDGSAWAVLAGGAPALAAVLASPATVAMAEDASASVEGSSIATYVDGPSKLRQLVFVPLPDSASRLYSKTHSMAMSGGLVDAGLADGSNAAVLVVLPTDNAVEPAGRAIARACPIFNRKSSAAAATPSIVVGFVGSDAKLLEGPAVSVVAPVAFNAVRLSARLAETPTEQMNTDTVEVSLHCTNPMVF
eukprot:COSAG02_NODE_130_length_34758_cov_80.817767_6_plen_221_part_00